MPEGLLSINQQFQLVASSEWETAELLGTALEDVFLREVHAIFAQAGMHFFRKLAQFNVVASPGADIAGEFASPEHPVKRDGDEWQRRQRHHPRDGALGGAGVHQGVQNMHNAEAVENDQAAEAEPGWRFKTQVKHRGSVG